MTKNKILYIFITILFVVLLVITLYGVFKNHNACQKELQENYIKTEAEITRIGRTGTGYRTKALLWVTYQYNDQKYSGTVTRPYKKEGYYKIGDKITINVNPNNIKDVK